MKLNIGCGEQKLEGFINIDVEESQKPDLIHDITKGALPYFDNSIDEIWCMHNIEHIGFHLWPYVFNEFFRLLKPEGLLFLTYPEFEVCAKYFVENHLGQRDFWRMTLFGRQLWPGDFHIVPVVTSELRNLLGRFGFKDFESGPSVDYEYYTSLKCLKGQIMDKEVVLKKELFNFTIPESKHFHKVN